MKKNFNTTNSNNSNSSNTTSRSIEQEITNIFRLLETNAAEGTVVRKDKAPKLGVCKGIVAVYNRIDLEEKGKNARPILSYSFYESTYRPQTIGSVAIYGDDASSRCAMIRRSGYLFGRRVRDVRVEVGRRPFVDVTFAL